MTKTCKTDMLHPGLKAGFTLVQTFPTLLTVCLSVVTTCKKYTLLTNDFGHEIDLKYDSYDNADSSQDNEWNDPGIISQLGGW